MRPRIIIIDLDGTLLDPAGAVPEAHQAAVSMAREQGLEIVVATGRNWTESRPALAAIEADGVMIAAGGAMLCDARSGDTLHRSALPADLVRSVTDCLLRHGHLVHLLQDHSEAGLDYVMVGSSPPDPATAWWLDAHDVSVEWIDEPGARAFEHTVRVGTVGDEASLQSAVLELEASHGDRVMLQHWPAVVESKATGQPVHLLEVFNAGVDKWTMVEHLLGQRSITPAEVVAIGDGLNDVRMIGEAGRGIAMGQGDSRVHAVSDHVVGCNSSGGVAEAIELTLSFLVGNG
ncbi:MAG: HAD-IIB family hydrolase [Phycisphaerales bacterium]|nr:HAD-IIB family hydrolase [Phycisphaerales bacterium]